MISVYNYAATPQALPESAWGGIFNGITLCNVDLYVPAESVSAYQAADGWNDFGYISAIPSACTTTDCRLDSMRTVMERTTARLSAANSNWRRLQQDSASLAANLSYVWELADTRDTENIALQSQLMVVRYSVNYLETKLTTCQADKGTAVIAEALPKLEIYHHCRRAFT